MSTVDRIWCCGAGWPVEGGWSAAAGAAQSRDQAARPEDSCSSMKPPVYRVMFGPADAPARSWNPPRSPSPLPRSVRRGQRPRQHLIPGAVSSDTTVPGPDRLPRPEHRRHVPPHDPAPIPADIPSSIARASEKRTTRPTGPHCSSGNTRNRDTTSSIPAPAATVGRQPADRRDHRASARRKNAMFAGRSPSRRMKYGYHSVPYGTYTRIRRPRRESASCASGRTP